MFHYYRCFTLVFPLACFSYSNNSNILLFNGLFLDTYDRVYDLLPIPITPFLYRIPLNRVIVKRVSSYDLVYDLLPIPITCFLYRIPPYRVLGKRVPYYSIRPSIRPDLPKILLLRYNRAYNQDIIPITLFLYRIPSYILRG